MKIYPEIISTVILPFPLFQEGQLSVSKIRFIRVIRSYIYVHRFDIQSQLATFH